MAETVFNYDEMSDALYISFFPGETGTGIEINENLLLRVNKRERRAIGLSVSNYSILAQPAETGRRTLPLTGLTELSDELRTLALEILGRAPLADLLALSSFTPTPSENIPIVSFRDAILSSAA